MSFTNAKTFEEAKKFSEEISKQYTKKIKKQVSEYSSTLELGLNDYDKNYMGKMIAEEIIKEFK